MKNSIMYLEDAIYNATKYENDNEDDTSFDRLIPYMMGVRPTLQFADSETTHIPEFYMNYPIYVDNDKFSDVKDEYYHIYKIYNGITDIIQLIPEEYVDIRPLMSDIEMVDAYLVDTLENEIYLGSYSDIYEYNIITGEVTLTSTLFKDIINGTKVLYKEIPDYDAYIVLEFNIEKYRDITEQREDVSSEEARKIAIMQSAHASILEYAFQYTLAEQTQERLNEIAYTIFVTITSTLIVMGITYGCSRLSRLASAGKLGTGFKKVSNFIRHITGKTGEAVSRGIAYNTFKVIYATISETFEELYVDPWIEAYVSNAASDAGLNEFWQIALSTLAESGRETIISGPTQIMQQGFQMRTQQQTQISQQLNSESMTQERLILSEQQREQIQEQSQTRESTRSEYIAMGISTILMFAGALSGGLFGSAFATLGTITIVLGGEADTIKDIFEVALKSRHRKVGNIHIDAKISDMLYSELTTSNWIAEDEGEAIEWATTFGDSNKPVPAHEMVKKIAQVSTQEMIDNMIGGMTSTYPTSGQVAGAAVLPSPLDADVAWDMFIDTLKNVLSQNRLVETMEFEGDPNYVRHEELEQFIDILKQSLRQYRSGLRRNDPSSIPSVKRVAALYLNLLKYVKTEIKQGSWVTIDNSFRTFYNSYQLLVGLAQDFDTFKKLFVSPESLSFDELKQLVGPSKTKTPIREALRTWIGNIFFSEFPRYKTLQGYRGFDNAILSRIFYKSPSGRRTGIFKGGYEYINLYKLFELLYRTEEITVTWLQQIGIEEANEQNVENLKGNIKRIVKNFIISNPFSKKYIYSNLKYISRDPLYFEPEFDLCLELYIAFSKENNGPLSLKEFTRQLGGYPSFTFHQAVGPMKWRTLKSLIGEFKGNYYQLGALQKKLSGDNYRRASSAIRAYLKERTVSPRNTEYHKDWDLSQTVDSHIIILLLRDLGMEVQGLNEIDSISFNPRTSFSHRGWLFVRHHIFNNDKKSIDPNRLVLTISSLHNSLENLDGNLVSALITQMLDWSSDTCPNYYKKLYPTKWRDKWEEVLDRREFIRKEGVGEFLLRYYPDVIKRVFGYSVKSATTIERRVRSIIDNWAQQYGLIPNLPIVVLNKLSLASSQTQITNFIGNPNPYF